MEEIEAKWLDIDPKEIEKRLLKLGAVKKFDTVFRRKVFEFPGWLLNKQGAWLRVRDEGDKVTLGYKRRMGKGEGGIKGDVGMEEIEVEVSDFEKTAQIFYKLGMEDKFYEENRRIEYEIDGVKVDIDFWPLLKPYVELEGKNWEEVYSLAAKLELKKDEAKIMPTWEVYKLNGINEGDYEVLTFEKQIKRQVRL